MAMAANRKQGADTDEYLSLYGAAEQLGITTKTVLARIVAGELEGKKVAGRIVVSRDSVARLKGKTAGAV